MSPHSIQDTKKGKQRIRAIELYPNSANEYLDELIKVQGVAMAGRGNTMALHSYFALFKERFEETQEYPDKYPILDPRFEAISQYGFAVPDETALQMVASCPKPIIEGGAGLAYWAYQLRRRLGVFIDCVDNFIPPYPVDHQGYKFLREPWYPVSEGDTSNVIERRREEGINYETLLLVWPDLTNESGYHSVREFTGSTVVYVGEGMGGCTGTNTFHSYLEEHFNEIASYRNPCWFGVHDYLTVYKRK